MKTLGGKQLWTDQRHFRQWRIQRHALTGHYRLLDPRNWRQAWGTFDQCRDALNQVVSERRLEQVTGNVIVVLHGLMRSRQSMAGMAGFLRENSDATVCNFEYASTRYQVADHAAALRRVVNGLATAAKIHFVGHSLGNLIVRRYLYGRYREADANGKDSNDATMGSPVGRTVMLGAPNRGTQLAARFSRNPVLMSLWGRSGNELARSWEQLQQRLATPRTEFGIIAGESVHNPFLSSKGDFVVKIEETRLAGATDFVVVRALHAMMMNSPEAQTATLNFLRDGFFISEEKRQPIAIEVTSHCDDTK